MNALRLQADSAEGGGWKLQPPTSNLQQTLNPQPPPTRRAYWNTKRTQLVRRTDLKFEDWSLFGIGDLDFGFSSDVL
jgi:hypothetical protein